MSKKMLIDATHAEETRVAVVDGHRLMEFDYESKVRKQLRSSIFLAKVTRVEPSLQAAFVNYGGNRHGFLPFSEIHPDYFRIPIADREALLAAQAAELEEHDEEFEDEDEDEAVARSKTASNDDEEDDEEEEDYVEEVGGADKPADDEADEAEHEGEHAEPARFTEAAYQSPEQDEEEDEEADEELEGEHDETEAHFSTDDETEEDDDGDSEDADESEEVSEQEAGIEGSVAAEGAQESAEGASKSNKRGRGRGRNDRDRGRGRGGRSGGGGHNRGRRAALDSQKVEMVGGDGIEGDRPFRFNMRHRYKIQEVIKRGQIMLIQVNKEERGNKGAAVSTYLSLPGRYCVLMPNSPRGGGVSRKIANYADRKRMREILKELEVPEGMSVILRTAGVARTSDDIKRDLDYLTRLWNQIREDTLQSSAPAVIYEEGNLIKRSIRDLYTKDIDDIIVSGNEGFKTASDFMKMLIPSHIKRVIEYKDERIPLFHKYRVESQIAEIGKSSVTLKSGGYLVINPTEALVSVDVNSGKSTKERHIEETAVKTNLEAADEVARQLRLRDLGGLVVVDFIDMEDRRNNRKVEQRLKDALSNDRARIQVGRISSFGLLELSRQRLNPSLTEMQFERCVHCDGVGFVPSLDFAAIAAMRALEEEGIKDRTKELSLAVPSDVGLYVLNHKREMMNAIERRYGFKVHIRFDDSLSKSMHVLEIMQKTSSEERVIDEDEEEADVVSASPSAERETAEGDQRRNGRRRGRRGGRNRTDRPREEGSVENASDDDNEVVVAASTDEETAGDDQPSGEPRRNRGRRGGRNRNRNRRDREDQGNGEQPVIAETSHQDRPPQEAPVLKAVRASNDSASENASAPRDYEKVNAEPEQKKRGWWNKLVE